MHNSKIKRVSLAVCLALMPFMAEAAGLGRLTVNSGLGEPFNAEIELSAGKDELSSLSARIAPSDVYAEHGMERLSALGTIRVEVARKPDGSSVLKLYSAQPVDDPFLDMLIQVDWPTGRLLREYTALLDPPGYEEKAGADAVAAAAEPASQLREPSKKNTDKSQTPVTRPQEAAVSDKSEAPKTYRTQAGDTLRSVARKLQVEDVSLEQMLVGLYRSNRSAFVGDNMNQLKVGRIMRAPEEDALRAIGQQEALEEVRLHASNWNAYRSTLAATAARSAPAAEAAAPQQAATGKIVATAEDKAVPPPPPGPRDVVKLSKAEVAAAKGSAGETKGAADDKLRALEEESTAQDNAIKEVTERIAMFEQQIADMQKLLVVQNQLLAELQQKGAAGEAVPATPPAAQPGEQPAAEKKPVKKPKPAPKKVAPPEPEPSLLDSILAAVTGNPLVLGAGGLLVLLGGGWLFVRNRRRKSLDSFEQGILSTSGLKADTVFGEAKQGEDDAGKTSFMTDFGQQGGGMIDTSDVDPISEADVYMAYGRDAQAEEILKDAIAKEPRRYELHQKLLEIYAKHKNSAAFETLAGELYAALGATSPIWLAVAELGRTLEPGNPMYAAATPAPAEATPAEPPAVPAESTAAADDNSLDFDLGSLAPEPEPQQAVEESLPQLDSGDETVAELNVAEDAPAEDHGLDFDFELPEPPAEGNVQLGAGELGMAEAEAPAELPELPTMEVSEEPASTEEVAELVLPEEELSPPAAEPAAAAAEDLSLDFPELSLDQAQPEAPVMEVAELEAEPASETASPELAMPEPAAEADEFNPPPGQLDAASAGSLDDVDFELPELKPAAEQVVAEEAPAQEPAAADDLQAEIDALDAAFEMPVEQVLTAETPAEPAAEPQEAAEEIVLEAPAQEAEAGGLDFNFDLDMGETPAAEPAAPESAQALPDLDLSSISLEMGSDAQAQPEAAEEITLSGGESADVDTKLDLVTAYMDMGDAEGARELLDEVLREGGPQQRARAQKLLDSLG